MEQSLSDALAALRRMQIGSDAELGWFSGSQRTAFAQAYEAAKVTAEELRAAVDYIKVRRETRARWEDAQPRPPSLPPAYTSEEPKLRNSLGLGLITKAEYQARCEELKRPKLEAA